MIRHMTAITLLTFLLIGATLKSSGGQGPDHPAVSGTTSSPSDMFQGHPAEWWARKTTHWKRAALARGRTVRTLRRTIAGNHPHVDSCLRSLIWFESKWKHTARNRSTGAYGLPQALPGRKMASAGADWQHNPETQIRWMIRYVNSRHGGSCGALTHFYANGWY